MKNPVTVLFLRTTRSFHFYAAVVVVFISLCTAAVAGPFETLILTSPKIIDIPARRVMTIINLAQQTGDANRGFVTVAASSEPAVAVLVRYAAEQNPNVPEGQTKDTIIAGPARVTVSPAPTSHVYITYKLQAN